MVTGSTYLNQIALWVAQVGGGLGIVSPFCQTVKNWSQYWEGVGRDTARHWSARGGGGEELLGKKTASSWWIQRSRGAKRKGVGKRGDLKGGPAHHQRAWQDRQ